MRTIKQDDYAIFANISDEECANRIAEGYRQSFDESCLISWDELQRRLDRMLNKKRSENA